MAIAATLAAGALAVGGSIYQAEKQEDMMEATVERRKEKAQKIEATQTKKRQSIVRNAISGNDDSLFDILGSAQA